MQLYPDKWYSFQTKEPSIVISYGNSYCKPVPDSEVQQSADRLEILEYPNILMWNYDYVNKIPLSPKYSIIIYKNCTLFTQIRRGGLVIILARLNFDVVGKHFTVIMFLKQD